MYKIALILLAIMCGYALPAFAHNGEDAHSAPPVPQSNATMELVAGSVVRMVVESRITNVTTQYVALLGDDGKRVILNGKGLDALQKGSRAEAIGWRNGATFAVSDFRTVAAAASPSQGAPTKSAAQVEGLLLLAHLDFFESGRGEYWYYVRDDAGRVTQINLATGDGLEPGMRVIARGSVAADGASIDVDVLTVVAPPQPSGQGHPIGEAVTNKVLVVLAKFSDSPASDPFTQAAVTQVMTNASTGVERYYNEVSYGLQSLDVTVTTWLTMGMATPAAGTCPWQNIGTAADAVINPATYPGPYQNRFYVFPALSGCGWSGLAYIGPGFPQSYGQAWSNGVNDIKVYAHELGHNFSLYHAASLQCAGGASIGGTCTSTEYGDPFDVMGNTSSMHFNTTQKAKLAWIPGSAVKTHGSGFQQYTIDALEIGSGTTYAVKIPIASNPNRTYWVEFRQPLGFDGALTSANANGAQIRVSNPFETDCAGCVSYSDDTQLLDMTASTTPGNFNDARLASGQSFVDSTYGITIQAVSNNLTQLVLNVTAPGGAATTTSLVSSLNPSPVGANVTFTASVTGTAPTGNVKFTDGGTTISGCGTVLLSGSGNTRTAACSTAALSAGTHSIVATYAGDGVNAISSSSPLSQVVNNLPATTTTLVSSLNPSTFAVNVTFTASVTGSAPTGTVNFTDGGTSIASCSAVALSGAGNTRTAACSTSTLSAGTHTIVAAYSGNAGNGVSSSPALSQVVNKVATATGLASSANPSNAGTSVTLTATVNGTAPTGNVSFTEAGFALSGCSAVALTGAGNSRTAVCSSSTLSVGSHSIVAAYAGDAGNTASSSSALLQGIRTSSGGTNVALASAGGVASASSTQSASYPVAAVNNNDRAGINWGNGGGWADGNGNTYPDWVEIDFSGTNTIDRVIVYTVQDNYTSPIEPYDALTFTQYGITDFAVQGWNGNAWVALSTLAGNNLVKRSVAFTAFTTDRIRINITGSLGLASRLTEVEAYGTAVAQTPTTTTVFSSTNPSTVGTNVTFTATVTGTAPTGSVAFTDGGTAIAGCSAVALVGSGNSPTASCSTGSLAAGTRTIVAAYAGNPSNTASNSAPLSQVVNPVSSTTTLFSSGNPSTAGANVTFTAQVTGSAPTGTVNFTDGGTTIGGCGAVALTGSGNTRSAACSTSTLSAGAHTIVAAYGGNAGNTASNSAPFSQAVNSLGSATTVLSSTNPSAVGVSVTFTASVTGSSPTGTVNFTDGGVTITACGAVALAGSGNTRTAACTTSSLSAGTHSIVAAYSGDGNNAASSSGPLSQVVNTLALQLTYTPVTPCRLVDTRVVIGAFGPRSERTYAASDNARIAQASGNAAGCGIPVGPEALALTVTVVQPAQIGNLIAYPAGTAAPLASTLNFLAGQIIANTTVVSITPGSGDNFAVFNNSDGTADIVVDVVGYFWEYQSADCSKATQSQSVGAGGIVDVPAACSTGYVAVGGGCSTNTAAASNWLARSATAAGDGYHCKMLNSSAGSVTVTADTMCCRRAGR